MQKQLWQNYQQSYFLCQGCLLPEPFAIITACNPYSRKLTAGQNAHRQQTLVNQLADMGLAQVGVLAGDRQMHWSEASVAVKCSESMAFAIAWEHEQNAFFWIERGQLLLKPCRLQGVSEVNLGDFARRLIAN